MYTKAEIFNLALGALLLQRQVTDPELDKTNEAVVLRTVYKGALAMTLADLDLDATSQVVALELIAEDPTMPSYWRFVYKYPTQCALLRRIVSFVEIDNRESHIPKRVGVHKGVVTQKAIFTNESQALAEVLLNDVPLSTLSAPAGLALAYRMAIMAIPLIVGKGAAKLKTELEGRYKIVKAEAQETDQMENFNFVDEATTSEFVSARLE